MMPKDTAKHVAHTDMPHKPRVPVEGEAAWHHHPPATSQGSCWEGVRCPPWDCGSHWGLDSPPEMGPCLPSGLPPGVSFPPSSTARVRKVAVPGDQPRRRARRKTGLLEIAGNS